MLTLLAALAVAAPPELAVQAGVTAPMGGRIRLSSAPERGWGWQVSVQAYTHPGDWRPNLAPLVADGGLWLAPRVGGLVRLDTASPRVWWEIGLSTNPVALVEGAILGGRADTPVLGVVLLPPLALIHAAEASVALAVQLTGPLSMQGGLALSGQALWWGGHPAWDEAYEPTDRELLQTVSPTLALELRL